MPALLNPRHEKCAQIKADVGTNNADIYQQVYGKRSLQAAHTLFKRADVVARVAELQNLRAQISNETTESALKDLGITKKWWLGALKLNAEKCLLGKQVYDTKGEPVPGKFTPPDVHGFNRSMEMIGRAMGVFIERIEIGGAGDFARMTDMELAARVEADAQALGIDSEATEALMLTFQGDKNEDPA